jgi:hypothetical protein
VCLIDARHLPRDCWLLAVIRRIFGSPLLMVIELISQQVERLPVGRTVPTGK